MQAALFTAVVTAFVLDAMSDLDEDNTAKLLRVLAKQNMIINPAVSAIEIPSPNPPPSILTVNSLWLTSIVSSLAATTWAILCLQWCAFLSDGVHAEDYEEMAEKRQRRFEAVKRWKMHLVVAATPFFLHLSLFLFLAGLWLRLRDMNKQLGLIVGVPSLVIVSSYVVMTLLPIFTDAPFFTSVSELAQPIVDEIRRIVKPSRFIPRSPTFSWRPHFYPVLVITSVMGIPFVLMASQLKGVPSVLASMIWMFLGTPLLFGTLSIPGIWDIIGVLPVPDILRIPGRGWTLVSLWISPYFSHVTRLLKHIHRIARRCIRALRGSLALLRPTFRSDQNPFDELNKLNVGHLGRGEGTHLRALAWLANTKTLLSRDEIKEILDEFWDQGNTGEHLNLVNTRLFASILSSFLGDDHIGDGEQLTFDYCATILAERMDRAFGNGEYSQRTLFRNTAVSEKLSHHFQLTILNEGSSSGDPTTNHGKKYWARAIPALWLCPSAETIRNVTDQLNSNVQSMETPHLRRIIRGLHAATLVCFNLGQITFELIPDFSVWSWDFNSSDQGLDKDLSAFLQSLFAAFYTTLREGDNPTTTPSLIIDCLRAFNGKLERYTPKLDNALCFFVAVIQRSDPEVINEGPSVANALLISAGSYRDSYRGEESKCATILANRLRAIAYGPKQAISWQNSTLKSLSEVYAGLPGSIRADPRLVEGFLDANAATLEATFAVDHHFQIVLWQRSPDHQTTRNICTDLLFTHNAPFDSPFDFVREHPNYRLPYLYSLAIALSYTTEGSNQNLWKVADLLVTRDKEEGMTIERVLDTNILVVAVLRFVLHDQPDTMEQDRKRKFLESLQNITIGDTGWVTQWKSIYLIADLVQLLSQMDDRYREHEQTESLIAAANKSLEGGKLGRVPSDWKMKREGLALCELEPKVEGLVGARGGAGRGVYVWDRRGNIPFLFLYIPALNRSTPFSTAAYWVATKFQR
jgi:hypothetical protein